eukprot:CFRG3818T1
MKMFDVTCTMKSNISEIETTLFDEFNDGQTSVVKTIINTMTVAIGVGMMGMPLAFAQAGWLFAVPCVIVAGITSIYTGHILGRCIQEANDGSEIQGAPTRSYTELGQRAAGRLGKYIAGFGIYGTCIGASVVFIILAEEMFSIVFGPSALDSKLWALIFVCATIPFTVIKTLNHVAIVACFGAVASILVFVVVVVEDIMQASNGGINEIDTSTMLFETQHPMNLATAATTIVFSFSAHMIFPESYIQMRKKTMFSRAVVVAFSFAMVIYLTISSVSYGVYGQYINGFSNILFVLPSNWGTKMMAGFLLIHLLSAFLVILNPVYRALELKFRIDDKKRSLVWRFLLRTFIIGILWFIAIAIPFFSNVMSLLGATTVTITTFICPPWFYMALFWPRKINWDEEATVKDVGKDKSSVCFTSRKSQRRELKRTEICLCMIIILVATFLGCLSTYQSLNNIIDNITSEKFF